MMPLFRRRRLSKRTRSRSSFRVPIDPRVLRLRYSSGNAHQQANIIRPLLQLVERQNSTLATLPRIRQARCEMEKKLDELNKRLEIFSELNDAYQALIDNLKGVQHDQSQKIEHLQSTIDRLLQEQQQQHQPDRSEDDVLIQEMLVDGDMEEEEVIEEEPVSLARAGHSENADAIPVTLTRSPSAAAVAAEHDEDTSREDEERLMESVFESDCGVVVDHQPQLETEIIYDFVL